MTYQKPELVQAGAAVRAIEAIAAKAGIQSDDVVMPTSDAYQSDE